MYNEFLFFMQTTVLGLASFGASLLGPHALVSFICLQALCANIFVAKQIIIFGLHATCADAFSVSAAIALILAQEQYGYQLAKNAVFISFGSMIFFSIISQLHLLYIPIITDTAHIHYQELFSPMPRIMIASLMAFFIAQLSDMYGYRLMRKVPISPLIASPLTIAISQLIDTILFTFLALSTITNHPFEIITISYSIKMAAACLIFIGARCMKYASATL